MGRDYMDRVIDEKRELDAKRSKLAEFIGGDIYPTLDEIDRDLLVEQLDLMKEYSVVLADRIGRFEELDQ
jgi:hypothetical protein